MRSYFDQNPKAFRLVFLVLIVPPLLTALLNFYYFLNRGSDESILATTQSNLYVYKSLPAVIINSPKRFLQDDLYYGIQVGDLLLEIDGQKVSSPQEVSDLLLNTPSKKTIRIAVQRPTEKDLFLEFQATRQFLSVDFVRQIPKTAHIFRIPSGGVADRAGLQVGDLVFRINGRQFEGAKAADLLTKRSLAGQTLRYELIRNNQELEIEVTVARVQISLLVLFFQLCGFLWVIAGLFIGFSRPQLATGRLLALGFFLSGISFTLMVNRGSLESDWQRTLLVLFTFPSHFFGLATLFYCSFHFPFEIPRILKIRWLPYGYYAIALAGTFFSIYYSLKLYFLWILLFLAFHYGIEFKFRKFFTAKIRSQGRIHSIATLVGLSIIIIWALLREVLPPIWQIFLPCLTVAIILAGYIITIARYRLLGFKVRRSFQYALVAGTWVLSLGSSFIMMLWLLSQADIQLPRLNFTSSTLEIVANQQNDSQTQSFNRMAGMLLCLLVAAFFFLVGRRGLNWLRQKFHRSPYDFHKVTHELHELLATRLPMEDLAKGIVTKLAKLMYLKQVGILFYRKDQVVAFKEAFPQPEGMPPFCMQSGAALCKSMKRYQSELCVDYLESDLKDSLSKQGYRYIYPIYSKEHLVGLLMVGEKLSEITFRHEDFAFLSTTTRQASVAIENGFLYERITEQERFKQELDIARRIQISSLPQKTPEIDGLTIAGTSVPAHEVGGDFYDYHLQGASILTVLIGDVSGKGTSAALYMSKLQGIFRTLLQSDLSPRDLFIKANPIIYHELDRSSFITAFGARFDMTQRVIQFSRAGHLPLVQLAKSSPKAVYLHSKGIALGLEEGPLLTKIQEEHAITFESGDLFLMMSDGITEALDTTGAQFGEDRILELLENNREKSPAEIMAVILEEVQAFSDQCEQHDDQTLVVIRIDQNTRDSTLLQPK